MKREKSERVRNWKVNVRVCDGEEKNKRKTKNSPNWMSKTAALENKWGDAMEERKRWEGKMNDSEWRNKKKSLSNKRSDVSQERKWKGKKVTVWRAACLPDWLALPPSSYRILSFIWIRNRSTTTTTISTSITTTSTSISSAPTSAANEFQSIDICRLCTSQPGPF